MSFLGGIPEGQYAVPIHWNLVLTRILGKLNIIFIMKTKEGAKSYDLAMDHLPPHKANSMRAH